MMNIFEEKSIFLEYWQYILPIIGLVMIVLNFRKRNNHQQKLDGAEYIGIDDAAATNNYNKEFQFDEYTPSLEEQEHIPFAGATITLDGGIDKFYELVNNRRSVRSFSNRPVSFEILKKCIAAAGTGPSGAHTEPWTFCIISDHRIKQEIRNIVETEEYLNYNQRMHRQWTTDLRPLKTDHIKEYLTDAPYLILIFKQIYGLRADGQKKQHYYNEISVAIATGILLCALQAAGLNSLITTPLNCGPALRELLQRPQNEKLLVLLPVGYASIDCKVPNLNRKRIDEILVKY